VPFDVGVADVEGVFGVLAGEVAGVEVVVADVARAVAASSPPPLLQPETANTPSIAAVIPIAHVTRMEGPLPVQNLNDS